jgi:CubicO group peptidase (beta-lactamase class C family)
VIQNGRIGVLLASGFADREAGTPMALGTQVPAASISKLFTAALGQRTIHLPGQHVVYANDGFTLAGFIAAQAEGQQFAAHAKQALLDPIGMTHSTWQSPWSLADRTLAAAYGGLLGGQKRTEHSDPTPSAANRFAMLPEHGAAAIVLSNLSDNAASSETADRILDLLVPPAPLPRYQPKPADLARMAGTYRGLDIVDPALWLLGYGVAFAFTPQGGTLWQRSRLTKESALALYGGVIVLALLAALGIGVWRLALRLRSRKALRTRRTT